jgi:hypothetical protein
MILHWLESKPNVRSTIAERHRKRFGAGRVSVEG